jgi:hypothetical protein
MYSASKEWKLFKEPLKKGVPYVIKVQANVYNKQMNVSGFFKLKVNNVCV